MKSARRRSRELATQGLYQWLLSGAPGGEIDAQLRGAQGFDKADALKRRPVDFKTYGIGAQILRELGVGKMQVLSNPRKLGSMSGYGLEVTGFVPMPGCPSQAPQTP